MPFLSADNIVLQIMMGFLPLNVISLSKVYVCIKKEGAKIKDMCLMVN